MATTKDAAQAPNYKGETTEQLKAFNSYVAMGSERSLRKLAKEIGKPEETVNKWSAKNKWAARIKAWDEEAAKKDLEKTKGTYLANRDEMKAFKYAQFQKLKTLAEGEGLTVHERIAVINAVKVELNEPTNITKGDIDLNKPNPLAEALGAAFGYKKPNAANPAN